MAHGQTQAVFGLGRPATNVPVNQPGLLDEAEDNDVNAVLVDIDAVTGLDADSVAAAEIAAGAVANSELAAGQKKRFAQTVEFDLDNGAGTTIDTVLVAPSVASTITSVKAIYTDATTGTVAAGSFKVGTTLGGAEVVAATSYENAKAVGTTTTGTIVAGAVAAGGSIFVRHTGVAATQAGKAVVAIEFTID